MFGIRQLKSTKSSLNQLLKNSIRLGHHHGPDLPPFARQRPPTNLLPEEVELVWDDNVSPETCIDFDAPQANSGQVFGSFFAMVAFLSLLMFGIQMSNPEERNPVAPRRTIIDMTAVKRDFGMTQTDEEE